MADSIRVSAPISGTDRHLTLETGRFAPQSQGAVVATIGDTRVLTTANAARDVRPGVDFFPLTVDVEEREEVRALTDTTGAHGGRQDFGLADAGEHRAVRLRGELPGGECNRDVAYDGTGGVF